MDRWMDGWIGEVYVKGVSQITVFCIEGHFRQQEKKKSLIMHCAKGTFKYKDKGNMLNYSWE